MSTTEESDLIARIARLEYLVNELEQVILSLQTRIAAAEQGIGQRWFS
jgi:hypothetical protein